MEVFTRIVASLVLLAISLGTAWVLCQVFDTWHEQATRNQRNNEVNEALIVNRAVA